MDQAKPSHWVIVFPIDEAHRAARLRHLPGVEVLLTESHAWFRGRASANLRSSPATSDVGPGRTVHGDRGAPPRRTDRLATSAKRSDTQAVVSQLLSPEHEQALLRLVPGVRPYLVGVDSHLTRIGERLPTGRLPPGNWRPLTQWLQIELPSISSTSPGAVQPVPISLVRCSEEMVPTLLMTHLSLLDEYVATAPSWRLERLMFVADGSGRALVRGLPLLPLPGPQWVERDGIATLAGWTWSPHIQASILRRLLRLQPGDLALFEPTQWQKIAAENWVRLTRFAVRSSLEAARAS